MLLYFSFLRTSKNLTAKGRKNQDDYNMFVHYGVKLEKNSVVDVVHRPRTKGLEVRIQERKDIVLPSKHPDAIWVLTHPPIRRVLTV
jgi:hypothetical protein